MVESEFNFTAPGYFVPGEVAWNNFLSTTQQKLFGIILNLCKNKKGCWASNSTLASYFGCHKNHISFMISSLERFRYIKCEDIYITPIITERHIYENDEYKLIYKPLVYHFHDIKDKPEISKDQSLKNIILKIILNGDLPDILPSDVNIKIKNDNFIFPDFFDKELYTPLRKIFMGVKKNIYGGKENFNR